MGWRVAHWSINHCENLCMWEFAGCFGPVISDALFILRQRSEVPLPEALQADVCCLQAPGLQNHRAPLGHITWPKPQKNKTKPQKKNYMKQR